MMKGYVLLILRVVFSYAGGIRRIGESVVLLEAYYRTPFLIRGWSHL